MSAYSDLVLAIANLLSYWRFGESSGTVADDAGPDGRDGTYTGTLTLGAAGLIGDDADTAISFPGGTSGHIALASALSLTGDFTVVFWVNLTGGTVGNNQVPFAAANTDTGDDLNFFAGKLRFLHSGSDRIVAGTTEAGGGRRMYALKRSGTALTLYRNGVSDATGIDSPDPFSIAYLCSAKRGGGAAGVYDDMAIWDRALSGSEITSLYATGTAARISPGGIASGEAFGTPTVTLIDIAPTGIPSGEAFGTPTIGRTVNPVGIPSGEQFGVPEINPPQFITDAGGIGPGAMGTPTVADTGPATISPAGIASSESFGVPRVWRDSDPEGLTPRELLYDPVTDTSYEWVLNHSAEDAVRLAVQRDAGGPNASVGVVRQQSYEGRLRLHLEGFILDGAQLDTFNAFFDASGEEPLIYRDAAGDEFWVVISRLDAPKQRHLTGYHWHYTMELEVIEVLSGPYVGVT